MNESESSDLISPLPHPIEKTVKFSLWWKFLVFFLGGVLFISALLSNMRYSSNNLTMLQELASGISNDTICSCPAVVTMPDCGSKIGPFLGGVDVVEYWSLDKDATGVAGKEKWQTFYNGYAFYFKNKSNLKLFEKNPSKYNPKFGGFCTWAITGEYCPTYPWAADCLGPSGNWGVWKITRGKLFFFLKDSARDLFEEDIDGYIAAGEARWAGWYPDESNSVTYNTNCYMTSADSGPGGSMAMLAANANGTTEGIALLAAKPIN